MPFETGNLKHEPVAAVDKWIRKYCAKYHYSCTINSERARARQLFEWHPAGNGEVSK
jgi:hypothetical protein